MKDFIIVSAKWHLETLSPGDSPEDVYHNLFMLVNFLQESKLTIRAIANSVADIGAGFELRSSDLSQEGMLLMRTYYERWLESYDELPRARDTQILERGLKRIRNNQ